MTPKRKHLAMALRIKILRAERGMSQENLAAVAGLRGAASISALESGKGNPTLETLEKIAKALGVRVIDLFDDDDRQPKAKEVYDRIMSLTDEEVDAYLAILRSQGRHE